MSCCSDKITVVEAAAFLECGEDRVLRALGDGALPGMKLGKAWVIPRQAFFAMVNERAVAAAAERWRKVAPIEPPRMTGEEWIEKAHNRKMPAALEAAPPAKRKPGRPRKVTIS